MDTDKLIEQAARCRRLARAVSDERTVTALREMAEEYEVLLALAQVDDLPDSD